MTVVSTKMSRTKFCTLQNAKTNIIMQSNLQRAPRGKCKSGCSLQVVALRRFSYEGHGLELYVNVCMNVAPPN